LSEALSREFLDIAGGRILSEQYMLSFGDGRSVRICLDADADDDISRDIRTGRFSLPTPHRLLLELAAPGDRPVLDLGAHVGIFSLYAASHGYPVVAFEPVPRNAALLRRSASVNGFDRLRVIESAVGRCEGRLALIGEGPVARMATAGESTRAFHVPVTTVSRTFIGSGSPLPAFIKMDIEGGEIAALDGMREILEADEAPPVVCESNGHTLHLAGHSPEELVRRFMEFGYRCHWVRPDGLWAVDREVLQVDCVEEILALPSGSAVPGGQRVLERPSVEETIERIQRLAEDDLAVVRAYLCLAISRAPVAFVQDERVRGVIRSLETDPAAEVRQAAIECGRALDGA